MPDEARGPREDEVPILLVRDELLERPEEDTPPERLLDELPVDGRDVELPTEDLPVLVRPEVALVERLLDEEDDTVPRLLDEPVEVLPVEFPEPVLDCEVT